MTRQNADDKGRTYLTEGRLVLVRVDGDRIEAYCRGQGASYRLGHDSGGWWCECSARGRCSHLVALMLVTDRRATR